MKFEYRLGGSCFSRSIELEWDEKTYTLTTSAMAMGGKKHDEVRKGSVDTMGPRVQFRDAETKKVAELYLLSVPSEFTWGDEEHETMCMANGANCLPQYNALLVGVTIPGYVERMVRGWYTA
jgi:hypothetical protein